MKPKYIIISSIILVLIALLLIDPWGWRTQNEDIISKEILNKKIIEYKELGFDYVEMRNADSLTKSIQNLNIDEAQKDYRDSLAEIENDTIHNETATDVNELQDGIKDLDDNKTKESAAKLEELVKKKTENLKKKLDQKEIELNEARRERQKSCDSLNIMEERLRNNPNPVLLNEIEQLRTKCENSNKEVKQKENEYKDLQKSLKILAMLCRIGSAVALATGNPQVAAGLMIVANSLETEAKNLDPKDTDGDPATSGKNGGEEKSDPGSVNPEEPATDSNGENFDNEVDDLTKEDFVSLYPKGGSSKWFISFSNLHEKLLIFHNGSVTEEVDFSKIGSSDISFNDQKIQPVDANGMQFWTTKGKGLTKINFRGSDGNIYCLRKGDNGWSLIR